MQQHSLGEGKAKKTRELEDESVRAIKRRFPGIQDSSISGHIYESENLIDFVKRHKTIATLAGKYLLDEVWDDAAKKFNIAVATPCAVRNKEEVVDPALVAALNAARTKDMSLRSRTALCSWFQNCKALNQRSLAGIIAHLVKLAPSASENAAQVVLAFLKLCKKRKLHEQHPEDLCCCCCSSC